METVLQNQKLPEILNMNPAIWATLYISYACPHNVSRDVKYCKGVFISREGVCALPEGLQSFSSGCHRLPDVETQAGCTSCFSYSERETGDRTK